MIMKKLFLLLLLVVLLFGCVLRTIYREQKEVKKSFVLAGQITTQNSLGGPIVVVVYTQEKMIIDYWVLPYPRHYAFYVPEGEYCIVAFEDVNSNFIYDKGEPSGHYGDPDTIETSSSQVIRGLDISISDAGYTPPDFLSGLTVLKFREDKVAPGLGTIVDLDDEMFDRQYGKKGVVQPSTFMKKIFGGVFFLEEYDDEKIPLLFIHGSGGTPRSWHFFIDNIDREKYQPWVFYYPSGLGIMDGEWEFSLEQLGYWVNEEIKTLHTRYHFPELYVTAFSMGGLIARSFILQNHADNQDYITLFVSISTPWGGHDGAKFGADRSPVVVPSWRDLATDSAFLEEIFDDKKELPVKLKYYLFYGYKKGIRFPGAPNNDGSISLESALYKKAQDEALERGFVYGFNENHSSILLSTEVMTSYNTILANLHQ
jgi:pimeloyl-ACP methyl ester carboxylesterase